MKQSELFTKTLREAPKDEEAVNAKLLTRAGFVDKLMAGVYSYLPLGLRVLRKIEQVVREEMNAIGGQEILMPVLHPKANWQTTGGWDKIDVLFKITSRTEKEYALGQSEEEVVTPLALHRVHTYKDLPLAVYQIHWKFRDELRAKSGLLRGREFFMKDMYSFHENQEDFDRFYGIAKQAYFRVFERLGLTAKATEASGGAFSEKISYEFMVVSDAGEDDIFYCDACEFCINAEIAKQLRHPEGVGVPTSDAHIGASGKEAIACPACAKGALAKARASEAANVFDLGQKYGKDFGLSFTDRNGAKQHPVMGCYGIGISRLMGIIVEKMHDDRGIVWPESVAPFRVHLVALNGASGDELYEELVAKGVEVLYDDRGVSAGEKLTDADLIGIPWRFVMSPKTEGKIEVKKRGEKEAKVMSKKEAFALLGV